MLLQLSPEENFRLYFHLTSLLSVIWCTWSNLLLASVWTGGHALMTAKHPIIWEALKERKENKIKDRESLCLDCFGNIVLNCHANEEQWTEENIGETDRVGGRVIEIYYSIWKHHCSSLKGRCNPGMANVYPHFPTAYLTMKRTVKWVQLKHGTSFMCPPVFFTFGDYYSTEPLHAHAQIALFTHPIPKI